MKTLRIIQNLSVALLCSCLFLTKGEASTIPSTETSAANQNQVVKKVSGKVIDEHKDPLIQASVRIKGTKVGTVTDIKGQFEFNIPNPQSDKVVLLVSFVGMTPKEVTVTTKTKMPLLISLSPTSRMLNEVVATGMQEIKRERMTGSAKVLTAKDLRLQGFTSIDKMMEGMVVGLNSTTVSGDPGARAQITIRGENTLIGNTEPLWIVDGLPLTTGVPQVVGGNYSATIMQDGVGNIMPEDIESVSILKDAAATSIYGARAANGVIVITTKKGFRSQTQVNYTGSIVIGERPKVDLGMMNTEEKMRYERLLLDTYGLDKAPLAGRYGYLYSQMLKGFVTPVAFKQEEARLASIDTDWMKQIFRPAFSHLHNLNVRGGTETLTYYTSISFNKQAGILKNNGYENAGILSNFDYRSSDKWVFSLGLIANARTYNSHASAVSPFNYGVFANHYEQPFNPDGSYADDLSYLANNYSQVNADGYRYKHFNILRELDHTKSLKEGSDVMLTFTAKYEPLKGLFFTGVFNRSLSFNKDIVEIAPNTYTSFVNSQLAQVVYYGSPEIPKRYDDGELSEAAGNSKSMSFRGSVDYSLQLNENNLLTFLGAVEIMDRHYTNFGYRSPIFYDDFRIVGLPNFDDANPQYRDIMLTIQRLYHTKEGQDRSVSYLFSGMYNLFQDRYVLTGSFRADGADMIGNTNRYTPLWSVGLKYNVHKEKVFTLPSWMTSLALRGSYGYTGNINRTALPFPVISISNQSYQGNRIVEGLSFPNPYVKWERKRDYGVGLETSIMDRVFLTADYYSTRTDDVFTELRVPHSTGRTTVVANGGVVANRGVELDLRVNWIENENLFFSTNVNVARNKNIILHSFQNYHSYSEAIKSSPRMGGVINIIGEEIGSIFGFKSAGVNPETGNPMYYLTDEAKLEYAKVLDGWETMDEYNKKRFINIIKDFNTIPDAVDMETDQTNTPPFHRPSLQYLGRSNPLLVGGMGTYLRYKRWEFSTMWSYKLGHIIPLFHDYFSAPLSSGDADLSSVGWTTDLGVSHSNRERKYLGFWKRPGDITNVPRFQYGNYDNWVSSPNSESYGKGDYIRLTNLSLSYRFDPKLLSNWHLNSLQLSFLGRNLLTLTKYRGIDVATGGAFNYPVAREYTFKVSLGI